MKMRYVKRGLAGVALATALTAGPLSSQVNYLDLSGLAARFPPSGWTNVQIFSTTGWQVLNVTSAAQVGSANVLTPNNSAIDAAAKIEAIIAATSGNRVLYFPPGTYYFSTPLQVTESNVFLQGDGPTATRFHIVAPATTNGEISFQGGGPGTEIDVTSLPSRGATSIPIASTSGLAVGDVIHVYDKSLGPANGFYHYGQMGVVTSVGSGAVGISPALGLSMISDPKITEVAVLRNVGIRGIRVFRDRAAADASASNVEFNYVRNGVAREVEVSWLERAGVSAFFSMDVVMITSFAHDAYDYGGGGQAYGFLLTNNTTRSRITDNKAWNLRHHYILQRGANHSIVSYNSAESGFNGTTGDLNIHGFTVHNSLFEGNMGRDLKADGRSDVGLEQYQGLFNTFYRNNLNRIANGRVLIEAPVSSGNFQHQMPNVIGNASISLSVASTTNDPWVGANRVNGTVILGDAPSGWSYPASLYLTEKPAYFETRPWPIFGPGLTTGGTFGTLNNLPAYDRARPGP